MKLDEAIKNLRLRNEKVPTPPRLPTEEEINAMELNLGIKFHPDYRFYLLNASDVIFGTLEPTTITNPKYHTHLPNIIKSARIYGVPENLFPFCEDNADFYCISQNGEVMFWSHNGWNGEKWPNLASWIEDVWIKENS